MRSIGYVLTVPTYRLSHCAELLGVSDDTVRRWISGGQLAASTDDAGRQVIDGAELAAFAQSRSGGVDDKSNRESARNRFTGLVTRVVRDTVMAQVELQCGPYRVVSLISREAADELGMEPGVEATASIKATNVVIELPPEN